jgi:hypothetical protein
VITAGRAAGEAGQDGGCSRQARRTSQLRKRLQVATGQLCQQQQSSCRQGATSCSTAPLNQHKQYLAVLVLVDCQYYSGKLELHVRHAAQHATDASIRLQR